MFAWPTPDFCAALIKQELGLLTNGFDCRVLFGFGPPARSSAGRGSEQLKYFAHIQLLTLGTAQLSGWKCPCAVSVVHLHLFPCP